MKEVTEWNGKPRMMWVWNDNKKDAVQMFVVYISSDEEIIRHRLNFKVIALGSVYKNCAEITEESEHMTNRGVAWWLRDHPEEHREWKNREGSFVCGLLVYSENEENEPCGDNILIRSNGGEWHEPLKEIEE